MDDNPSQAQQEKRVGFLGLTECGGCSSLLTENIEKILAGLERKGAVVLSEQYADEGLGDQDLDVLVVYGCASTTRDLEVLQEAVKKAKKTLAMGTCAIHGGVMALRNTTTPDNALALAFLDEEIVEPGGPPLGEGAPRLIDRAAPVPMVVGVDGVLAGCPPKPQEVVDAIAMLLEGRPVGLPKKSLCSECPLSPVNADGECLIEKGVLCTGLATALGCGALCPSMGVQCTGCYGPPENSRMPALRLIDALSNIKNSLAEWGEPDACGLMCLHTIAPMLPPKKGGGE